jgi:hypothetical protein
MKNVQTEPLVFKNKACDFTRDGNLTEFSIDLWKKLQEHRQHFIAITSMLSREKAGKTIYSIALIFEGVPKDPNWNGPFKGATGRYG